MSERTEKEILGSIEDHLRNINQKTKRIDKNVGFFFWSAILTFLGGILLFVMSSCEPSPPHDEISAKVEVQFYIQDKLKSPSSAEFGGETAKKTGENTYHVEGHVDSQNGFGAMVRTYYECDVEFSPDGKKRSIKNLKMI